MGKTGISYIIPSCNAERTVLAYRGLNADLLSSEIPYESFKEYSHIYISSLTGQSAQLLLPITKKAKESGCIVINNPGINQCTNTVNSILASLPSIDILIFNYKEAEQCMLLLLTKEMESNEIKQGEAEIQSLSMPLLFISFLRINSINYTLRDFFKKITVHGPKIIVVTNGNDGVYVYHEGNNYFHPSLAAHCLSTLGAGDALGAAFVAGIAQGYAVQDAIRMGIINSASVIGHLDAKKGLMFHTTMHNALTTLDHSLLKKIF